MPGRSRRQQLIIEVLQRQPVESQEDLRQALAGRGVEVTQATLSRDLRELGAVKTPRGYQLPQATGARLGDSPRSITTLARALSGFVTGVEVAGNLIVLKTGPGHAQIVALELDRSRAPGVVGCLAGDDTIFIAATTVHRAKDLARELAHMAQLEIGNGVAR